MSDVMWTRGGCEYYIRGRGPTAHSSKNCYEWILNYETWPVQNVQTKNAVSSSRLYYNATNYTLIELSWVHAWALYMVGPLPLTSFSCPPCVHLTSTWRHSRDQWAQAFPIFRALPLPCIILNANRRTKRRKPGNEASMYAHTLETTVAIQ